MCARAFDQSSLIHANTHARTLARSRARTHTHAHAHTHSRWLPSWSWRRIRPSPSSPAEIFMCALAPRGNIKMRTRPPRQFSCTHSPPARHCSSVLPHRAVENTRTRSSTRRRARRRAHMHAHTHEMQHAHTRRQPGLRSWFSTKEVIIRTKRRHNMWRTTLCPRGRRRRQCKRRVGVNAFSHGRDKNWCKECGGQRSRRAAPNVTATATVIATVTVTVTVTVTRP